MSRYPISKIVSGGQTGVDRAALDVAIFLGIEHGGWCPADRRSEDGAVPQRYQLKETDQRNYTFRTEKNVVDSDGTLVLYCHNLSGGTALTCRLAYKHRRPLLSIDLVDDESHQEAQSNKVVQWLMAENISVLNVAGPRESSHEHIGRMAEVFLLNAIDSDEAKA